MGVRFGREYADIHKELTEAVGQIAHIHDFFEMSDAEWSELSPSERSECIRTVADDLFYGLGSDRTISVCAGTVRHDPDRHVITVSDGDKIISIVHLT